MTVLHTNRAGGANARLREVLGAKDAEIGLLLAGLDAARERERRLELRLAELSAGWGWTARTRGRLPRRSGSGLRKSGRRGGGRDRSGNGGKTASGAGSLAIPGRAWPGSGSGQKEDAPPPAQCRECRAGLDGAGTAGFRWAQVIDAEIIKKVTEWVLPGLVCPCCGTVTFADAPPGAHAGSVSYGPVLNAAAVLLTAYGNVPPERAAQLIGMLLSTGVSPGWVDKASSRLSALLGKAGLDAAMLAALAGEKTLAADETPVNVLDKTAQPPGREEKEEDPEDKDGTAAAGLRTC